MRQANLGIQVCLKHKDYSWWFDFNGWKTKELKGIGFGSYVVASLDIMLTYVCSGFDAVQCGFAVTLNMVNLILMP